jgi:hypothetical protein
MWQNPPLVDIFLRKSCLSVPLLFVVPAPSVASHSSAAAACGDLDGPVASWEFKGEVGRDFLLKTLAYHPI